jgi:hypothetical protein
MVASGEEAKIIFESGVAAREAGELDQALVDFLKAKTMLEEMGLKDSLFHAKVMAHYGDTLAAKDKLPEGLALMSEAKASYQSHGVSDSPDYLWLIERIAQLQRGEIPGQIEEAAATEVVADAAKQQTPAEALTAAVENEPVPEASGPDTETPAANTPASEPVPPVSSGQDDLARGVGPSDDDGKARITPPSLSKAKAPGIFGMNKQWLLGAIITLTFFIGLRCAKGEKGHMLDVENSIIRMEVRNMNEGSRITYVQARISNASTADIILMQGAVALLDENGEVLCQSGYMVDNIAPGGVKTARLECYGASPEEIVGWRPSFDVLQIKKEKQKPILITPEMGVYKLEQGLNDTLEWYEPISEQK